MRREDAAIAVMSLVPIIWAVIFLPTLASSFPYLSSSDGNPSKEVMLLAKPPCMYHCDKTATYVITCISTGGSGKCWDRIEYGGCVHALPQPSGHELKKVTDLDETPCAMCGNQWLEWTRLREYKCELECASHVFSKPGITEPKYRYDDIVCQ